MRYAQLVMGPAGCGKSTYCSTMMQHASVTGHSMEVINLDPAAEYFDYNPIIDIRDLIKVDDVMEDEDLQLGPNGGLVFCMEYMIKNTEWLSEVLSAGAEDEYLLFDCPGQIELYTHMTVFQELVAILHRWDIRVCGVFMLDSQFMVDGAKFLSGATAALSVMINLQIPHVNVLTKVDLLSKSAKKHIDKFLDPDSENLLGAVEEQSQWGQRYCRLTEALGQMVDSFGLVRFVPLDRRDEENIADVLLTIDNAIQYGEDADVKTKDFEMPDPEDQDLWGALHAFLFNILVFLLAMAHLKAVCSDPGVVPLPHSRLDFSDMQPGGEQCSEGDGEWTVCTRCETVRPPRAHHCRICRRCVRRMDHHCPWINNCVGERNQKYFLQFLVYVGILAAYAIGLVVGSWIHECEDCSHEVSNKQSRILHSVLLVLESALFGLFVVAILVDQLSAILNDSTAVEQLQQTGPYRPGRTARALLSEVCGEGHPIFWLLPCQSREFASTPQSTSSYDV